MPADDAEAWDDDEIDRVVKEGIEELDAREDARKVTVLECPECGRSDLSYVAAMQTGHQYQCPHCGYQGALAIERERTPAELRKQAGMEP